MEDSLAKNPDTHHSGKRRRFWEVCATFVRWAFIVLFAVCLMQGLYFRWAIDFHFPYMWTILSAIFLIELFLLFSPARWRQYLVNKLVKFFIILKAVFVFLFRWFLILLFAVILLCGLYFRAPWKVLVLDAVLLALLTIVPKKKRKYGWLALGVAALAVTVWIFLPESDSGNWQAYTFDKEVLALNDKYSVPEDENAAPYYAQIKLTDFYEDVPQKKLTFNLLLSDNWEKRGPDLWDPNDATLSRPWTADEFPEMATWLETEKEKIAPFFEAVKYKQCWFALESDPNTVIESLRISVCIKKAAVIMQRMIYQDLGNNKIEAAIDKTIDLLICASHLQQQGSLTDHLIGWSIYSSGAGLVRDITVHYPIDVDIMKQLETKNNLFEMNWEDFCRHILAYDKVLYKNIMGRTFEVNKQGEIRAARQNYHDPFEKYNLQAFMNPETGKKRPSAVKQERLNKLGRFISFMTYSPFT